LLGKAKEQENGLQARAFRIAAVLVVDHPIFLLMDELNPFGKGKNVEICDHGAGRRVRWKRDLDLLQVRMFGQVLISNTTMWSRNLKESGLPSRSGGVPGSEDMNVTTRCSESANVSFAGATPKVFEKLSVGWSPHAAQ
jgi:hypothetical protein